MRKIVVAAIVVGVLFGSVGVSSIARAAGTSVGTLAGTVKVNDDSGHPMTSFPCYKLRATVAGGGAPLQAWMFGSGDPCHFSVPSVTAKVPLTLTFEDFTQSQCPITFAQLAPPVFMSLQTLPNQTTQVYIGVKVGCPAGEFDLSQRNLHGQPSPVGMRLPATLTAARTAYTDDYVDEHGGVCSASDAWNRLGPHVHYVNDFAANGALVGIDDAYDGDVFCNARITQKVQGLAFFDLRGLTNITSATLHARNNGYASSGMDHSQGCVAGIYVAPTGWGGASNPPFRNLSPSPKANIISQSHDGFVADMTGIVNWWLSGHANNGIVFTGPEWAVGDGKNNNYCVEALTLSLDVR